MPDKLIQSLLQALPTEPVPVSRVVVGVHWTLVSSTTCGLASTLVGCGPHGHSRMRDVGLLNQKSAQELAQWVLSDNLLEASVGMAAINSLVGVDESKLEQVNAAEVISREGKDKNVVVVGHFPFVEKMKRIPRNCWVIEKRPFGDDFPEEAAQEFIPQADVIAITGTAFINHTMDKLLALCPRGSLVMILGPSTPLSPLLFDAGVSFLSGARVDDEETATRTILQGAALPQVKGIRLVTMGKAGMR
jgi:uncharacterized protein (DUF4213/DUF364 family)